MRTIDEIISAVRAHHGVTRKSPIGGIARHFFSSKNALADFGEDCAVLKNGSSVILFACDGIMESLVKFDPYFAGYCAVLVNANDIAAMGGTAIAAVNLVSYTSERTLGCMLDGLAEGSRKFGVPIVGGHTHPYSSYDALDVSVIGEAPCGKVLYSDMAKPGDAVIFAIDLDGKFTPGLTYSFDTTLHKTSKQVQKRLHAMRDVAEASLSKCAKDISNPGALGTLAMMLESSNAGARVDVRKIPKPKYEPLLQWLLAYQGCGFVLTCKDDNVKRAIAVLENAGLDAACAGTVTRERKLTITDGNDEKVLFDFRKEGITGLGKASRKERK